MAHQWQLNNMFSFVSCVERGAEKWPVTSVTLEYHFYLAISFVTVTDTVSQGDNISLRSICWCFLLHSFLFFVHHKM